jgi:hypothetical protein
MSDRPRGRELGAGGTLPPLDDDDEQDEHENVATSPDGEWRPVGPNEVFAPGCSFRVNVSSGVTEVRVEPGDAPAAAASITTLSDLVHEPLWVAWRVELRGPKGKEKPTKVPYTAPDRRAEADNPATWLTHDAAAAVADMIKSDLGGGVGIMLGGPRMGVDLDCCRDPVTGAIEPWAREVLDRLGTYAEVSPSLAGIKAYPLIDPAAIEQIRSMMGSQHGRSWKRVNGGGHPPAIELYISNRFFAVTWQELDDYPSELQPVSLDDLRWLIEVAGPTLAGKANAPTNDDDSRGGDVDENILVRLDRATANNKALAAALRNAATMKGGSRSEGALGLGAALRRAGWAFDDMKAALLACPATREWATEKRTEGDRQFERIWERGGKETGTEQTDDWPEPVDFLSSKDLAAPILTERHVPPSLWPYIADTAERLGVATSSVALCSNVSCAAAISEEWQLQPKRHDYTWTEGARLWGAMVGPPSLLKSPTISETTAPIDVLEMHALDTWNDDMAAYVDAHAAWKDAGDKTAPEPKAPRRDRYLVESVTVEALQEVLRDDAGGKLRAPLGKVLARQDELSEFLANLDKYSTNNKGGDRGAWLRAYNGGRFSVDRIGRGPFATRSWSACLLGGIQSDVIQRVARQTVDDGLIQRFMLDIPGPQAPGQDRAPNHAARDLYRRLFPVLATMRPAKNVAGYPEVVTLHAEAHGAREDIDRLARVMAAMPDASARLASTFGKWPGLFARLCLTFHLIEIAAAHVRGEIGPHRDVVSVDTAERVRRYMRAILAPSLLRGEALIFATAQTEHAAWIANHILAHRRESITAREVVQNYRSLRAPEDRRILDSVMDALCTFGWLRPVQRRFDTQLPTAWTVNPSVHSTYAERAEAERKRRDAVRETIVRERDARGGDL